MKNGPPSVSNYKLDPQTAQYVNGLRSTAMGAASAGPNSSMTDAMAQWKAAMGYGQSGMAAMSGDPTAQAQFLNPYLSAMDPFFQQQRSVAVNQANQQSTMMGAFGGDRSGIAAATAGNLADQNQAQFNYQGFNDSMNRAGQVANLGMGATGSLYGAGMNQWTMPTSLLGAGTGPYGSSTSTSTSWSPLMAGLGAASMFLPGGQLAGLLKNFGMGSSPTGAAPTVNNP